MDTTWYVVFAIKSGNARAKFRNALDALEYMTNRPDLDMRKETSDG
jgi:hypothetical protein